MTAPGVGKPIPFSKDSFEQVEVFLANEFGLVAHVTNNRFFQVAKVVEIGHRIESCVLALVDPAIAQFLVERIQSARIREYPLEQMVVCEDPTHYNRCTIGLSFKAESCFDVEKLFAGISNLGF